jgi:hypothetical protein
MRIEDAPPAGWYPDPEGTSRLRWWEGTDWSDRYRARPLSATVQVEVPDTPGQGSHRWVPDDTGLANPNVDTQVVVDQVRMAARQEAERAAQMFGQQARSAARSFTPLISEYTNRVIRWFRIAAIIIVIGLILWVAFQIFAQVSLFQWIGDRIDNLTDNIGGDDTGALGALFGLVAG